MINVKTVLIEASDIPKSLKGTSLQLIGPVFKLFNNSLEFVILLSPVKLQIKLS